MSVPSAHNKLINNMNNISVYNGKDSEFSPTLVYQNEKGVDVTTSLIVAQVFGKEHNKVCRDIESLSCSNSFNTANFGVITYTDSRGRKQKAYTMTKDGFSFLVMGYTGKKAGEFKEKFINQFNEMERKLINIKFQVPRTYSEALQLAADQAKQIEELHYQNLSLSKENEEVRPKAEFADCIMQSEDCISVGEMANILKQNGLFRKGQNAFYSWLRYNGYLLRRGTRYNLPSQKSMNNGIMKIAESTFVKKDNVCITRKTVITPAGQRFFINLLRNKSKKQVMPDLLFI